MTTLTKEHLDQALSGLEKRFDKQLDGLHTEVGDLRKDMDARFDTVEQKIETEIHSLATMTAKGLADLEKRLDVKDRLEVLERKMTKVESAINADL